MKYVYIGFTWTFGIFFLLIGLFAMFKFPLSGYCFLAISALLLPPARNFIYSQTGKELSTKARVLSIFVLLFSSGLFSMQALQAQIKELEQKQAIEKSEQAAKKSQEAIAHFKANRSSIISSIEMALSEKKFDSAIAQIDKYSFAGDEELKSLRIRAGKEFESRKRVEATEQLLTELKSIPKNDYYKNRFVYQQLLKLNPDEALYKTKEAFYLTKIQEAERAKKVQEERRIATALNKMSKRTDKIEGVDWYKDKSSPVYDNSNGFFLYIGKRSDGAPWLRLRIQYHADRWLFIESFIVVADGQRFEQPVATFERDNDSMIWEWYDEKVSESDMQMIKSIISSKDATIRLNGHQYHKDVKIKPNQKTALQNVLDAYSALGGK
jgi:hypothetical protein